MRIAVLGRRPRSPFPPLRQAQRDPNGLLAVGRRPAARAAAQRLPPRHLSLVQRGRPILWWSPDPRVVFDTATSAAPRFRRTLRGSGWR
jgi:leucyl/phenylalanyl-tRNA--protein transferase